MLSATDSKRAPWRILRSDGKRRARLDCISHILKSIPSKLCNSTTKVRRGAILNEIVVSSRAAP
jgi:hypothetical protein